MSGQLVPASTSVSKERYVPIPPVENRWKPGQSGNPSGRNLSVYHAVRRLASSVSVEATEKLIELMRKSDDDRVAYMAIMALLERGPGKPRDHSDEDAIANRLNIAALEPDERAAFAKLLAKLMGM